MTRINVAKLAIVPRWVVLLPGVQGNPTRIATYVAIRIIEYANQGREWASERELANDIAEVSGVGAEATRKHLRALRQLGAVRGDAGEIVLPTDEPSGDHGPHSGDVRPQSGDTGPHAPSLTRGKDSKTSHSDETDEIFEKFWNRYPRRQGTSKKRAASAFKSAVKRGHLEQIRTGMRRDLNVWTLEKRAITHIPHASTWLNEERYMPETDGSLDLSKGSDLDSEQDIFHADGTIWPKWRKAMRDDQETPYWINRLGEETEVDPT